MDVMDTSEPNDIKPQINNITPAQSLTVDQLDVEILPVIYDIIRWYKLRFIPHSSQNLSSCVYVYWRLFHLYNSSFEKDPTDNASKQRESQECSQKVSDMRKWNHQIRTDVSSEFAVINHLYDFCMAGAGIAETTG